MDMKEQKLTVIGTVDPVTIVSKLRKFWRTDIFSVGPAKEPEKKEEPKREEAQKEPKNKEETQKEEPKNKEEAKDEKPKKEEGKKEEEEELTDTEEEEEAEKKINMQEQNYYQANKAYYPHATTHYYVQGAEEDPNGCIIV